MTTTACPCPATGKEHRATDLSDRYAWCFDCGVRGKDGWKLPTLYMNEGAKLGPKPGAPSHG